MLKHHNKGSTFIGNEAGMTLMEVLMAIAVLGIVAAAFLTALGGGLRGTILADERTVAESLARSQLEAIRNAKYDDTPPYQYDKITGIPEGYDVTIAVDLFDPETQDASLVNHGFQRILITVFHGEKQVFQVETYKEER